jgi:membrane-associated phospholipid phosphatase
MFKRRHKGFWVVFFAFQLIGWIGYLIYGKAEFFLLLNSCRNELADLIFYYATMLGEWPLIVFVLLFTALFHLNKVHKAAIIFLLNGLISYVLKQHVFKGLKRPLSYFEEGMVYTQQGIDNSLFNSFPSGHTLTAFTGFFFLTLLSTKSKFKSYLFGVLAVLAAYSRIYNGQHFAEDLLVGSCLGVLISYLIYTFVPDLKFNKQETNKL